MSEDSENDDRSTTERITDELYFGFRGVKRAILTAATLLAATYIGR